MNCGCGGKLKVSETREFQNNIYRRRVCTVCRMLVYTCEAVVDEKTGKQGINYYQNQRLLKRGVDSEKE